MSNINKKVDKKQRVRFQKAARDLKKIEAEIAPYTKRKTYTEETREDGWHKTSGFLLS